MAGLRLISLPGTSMAQEGVSEPMAALLDAIEGSATGTRFDISEAVLTDCVLRLRKADSVICERGFPHSFHQYETVIDLRLLPPALPLDRPEFRDGDYHVRRVEIAVTKLQRYALEFLGDAFRDQFATAIGGVARDLPWETITEREAAFQVFLEERVLGIAPMYRISTTCDGTRWLGLHDHVRVVAYSPELPLVAGDVLLEQIKQCR